MYNVHVGVHVHVWYMYVWRLALPFVILPRAYGVGYMYLAMSKVWWVYKPLSLWIA